MLPFADSRATAKSNSVCSSVHENSLGGILYSLQFVNKKLTRKNDTPFVIIPACISALEASSGQGLADTWKRKLDTIVSCRNRYVEAQKKYSVRTLLDTWKRGLR